MNSRRIRPGDGAEFESDVVADIAMDGMARIARQHGQVAGFMKQVAGVEEATLIDDERAAIDSDTGDERWRRDDQLFKVA